MTVTDTHRRYIDLQVGDPAPVFQQRSLSNPRYVFDTAAGRYLVLCFFGSAADPGGAAQIAAAARQGKVFNDSHASFFGVSTDPEDETAGRLKEKIPGYRFLLDFDGKVSRLYGALPATGEGRVPPKHYRRLWVALDPTLRVVAVARSKAPEDDAQFIQLIKDLPPPDLYAGIRLTPPILYLPNVFDVALCQRLIDAYDAAGGQLSGVMREESGKTVLRQDPGHKRRRDHILIDQALISECRRLIQRRVIPEIRKIHQFDANRMERHLVGCYTAEDGGHFRPHRDNTTKGTAHRRFAVSINLNSDFEGGQIAFPEYGSSTFKPPPGGAVVFSCSLLHAVTPVTAGRRYAFLPFLYDDAAARLREENAAYLEGGANYKAGL